MLSNLRQRIDEIGYLVDSLNEETALIRQEDLELKEEKIQSENILMFSTI